MFTRKEVIITLVVLLVHNLSSVAFSEDKLTGSLAGDAELIAALGSQVNDEPHLDVLESLTKPEQDQSESSEASTCVCDKSVKSTRNKATEPKSVATKAVKNDKSDKKIVADKKSGKKFKVITVDPASEGDLDETVGLSDKKEKVAAAETKLVAPGKEEEDQETEAADSREESEKVTKSKGSKNDAEKEKESSKKTKTDKKRSKRDAKSKLSKGKKSIKTKEPKKNQGNYKK